MMICVDVPDEAVSELQDALTAGSIFASIRMQRGAPGEAPHVRQCLWGKVSIELARAADSILVPQ